MEGLLTNSVGINITTRCTLNCKLCSTGVSLYEHPEHSDFQQIRSDMSRVFQIYSHIHKVDILGGEPMFHPQIAEIVNAFLPYSRQFDELRIITNGTIAASDALVSAAKKYDKFTFVIDNYGKLSKNVGKLRELLQQNGINYAVNDYFGENQHCGGWVDMGDFHDKGYTAEALKTLYHNCHPAHYICLNAYNGHLYHCATAMLGRNLGLFPEDPNDSIDLGAQFDLQTARLAASQFGTRPIEACKYCNGFDPEHSPRFPAAEQIKRKWKEENK